MKNNTGTYLFEDSLDTRYVHDKYMENYGSGFFTGGQQKEHTKHRDLDQTVSADLTWQATHNHSFKLGLMGISHDVKHKWQTIRNKFDGQDNLSLYEPEVLGRLYCLC